MLRKAQDKYIETHRQEYDASVKYATQSRELTEYGHTLGIPFTYEIFHPGTKKMFSYRSEAGQNSQSISALKQLSDNYLLFKIEPGLQQGITEPRAKEHFTNINQALRLAHNHLDCSNRDTLKNLSERANNKEELSIVPCTSYGHTLGLARYGDFLLLTNRGLGKLQAGTTIFKLKPGVVFDEQLLKDLSNPEISTEIIQKRILELVDDSYIGIPLPVKDQKIGTCSFVNPKSNVEAALFAQRFYELPVQEQEKIFAQMKKPLLEQGSDETEADFHNRKSEQEQELLRKLEQNSSLILVKKYAETHYKDYTKFIRDHSLKMLIGEYNSAKETSDLEFMNLFKTVLAEYIIRHPGSPKAHKSRGKISKEVADLQRIEKILSIFNAKELSEFITFTEGLEKEKIGKDSQLFANITQYARANNLPGLVKLLQPPTPQPSIVPLAQPPKKILQTPSPTTGPQKLQTSEIGKKDPPKVEAGVKPVGVKNLVQALQKTPDKIPLKQKPQENVPVNTPLPKPKIKDPPAVPTPTEKQPQVKKPSPVQTKVAPAVQVKDQPKVIPVVTTPVKKPAQVQKPSPIRANVTPADQVKDQPKVIPVVTTPVKKPAQVQKPSPVQTKVAPAVQVKDQPKVIPVVTTPVKKPAQVQKPSPVQTKVAPAVQVKDQPKVIPVVTTPVKKPPESKVNHVVSTPVKKPAQVQKPSPLLSNDSSALLQQPKVGSTVQVKRPAQVLPITQADVKVSQPLSTQAAEQPKTAPDVHLKGQPKVGKNIAALSSLFEKPAAAKETPKHTSAFTPLRQGLSSLNSEKSFFAPQLKKPKADGQPGMPIPPQIKPKTPGKP